MFDDFRDLRGPKAVTDAIRKATTIARAGRPLLLSGPPGVVIHAIARRLVSMLPDLTDHAARWIAAEYDGAIGGYYTTKDGAPAARPVRVPHYTASQAAMLGSAKRAGEVQLARHGALILDDLPQWSRATIDGIGATVRRMAGAPLVIATAAPCPCGVPARCACSAQGIAGHVDRVTRHRTLLGIAPTDAVIVPPVSLAELTRGERAPSTAELRAGVS